MIHDFSGIKYDVHNLGRKDRCVDRYKDLGLFRDIFMKPDLPESLDPEIVLRYLILTYTPSSPFAVAYGDLHMRKTQVLEYLGINGKMTQDIEDMALLRTAAMNIRFITFLRVQSNEDWQLLCVLKERYNNILMKFSGAVEKDADGNPVPEDIKAKEENDRTNTIKNLGEQIKIATRSFLAGEKAKLQEEFLNFSLLGESNNYMPEKYVPIWAETKKLPYKLYSL